MIDEGSGCASVCLIEAIPGTHEYECAPDGSVTDERRARVWEGDYSLLNGGCDSNSKGLMDLSVKWFSRIYGRDER